MAILMVFVALSRQLFKWFECSTTHATPQGEASPVKSLHRGLRPKNISRGLKRMSISYLVLTIFMTGQL